MDGDAVVGREVERLNVPLCYFGPTIHRFHVFSCERAAAEQIERGIIVITSL